MRRIPWILAIGSCIARFFWALKSAHQSGMDIISFLVNSRERTNFTYHLTSINRTHLAGFVANLTGKNRSDVLKLFSEIENDQEMVRIYRESLPKNRIAAGLDDEVRLARRLAWYALVRLLRPQVVVETGTDKGLGSLVLLRAVLKNGAGVVYTVDINPESGELLKGLTDGTLCQLKGDAVEVIKSMRHKIDFFVQDGCHEYGYERSELAALESKLSRGAIVVSDNAGETSALLEWSDGKGEFNVFREEPDHHPYKGATVAVVQLS